MKIEEEDEDIISAAANEVNIFLHILDPLVISTKVVSTIYKIVINPSASLTPLVKHVFTFSCEDQFFPSGMSFVRVGSIFYFMGGSITYSTRFLSLDFYNDTDPLGLYPSYVYAFDSKTSKLLDFSSPYWIPPMISGKTENPIIFLVGDQIYVLCSEDGPGNMIHFETFSLITREWNALSLPRLDFFEKSKNAQGSFVIDDTFVVTYLSEKDDYHVLWYDIGSDTWIERISYFIPTIFRDPLCVGRTLYSLKKVGRTLSFLKNDRIHFIDAHRVWPFYDIEKICGSFCPYPMQNWPADVHRPDVDSDRCLFHFGDSCDSTTYLGFVEFLRLPECPCEFRFVLLKIIEGKPSEFIHASRFSCDISSYCSLAGAACVP